jgi:hypothetical protein
VRAARPAPEPHAWGPDDWFFVPELLAVACIVGGFLAAVVWEDNPYLGGWLMFAGAQVFALSVSLHVWRSGRRAGGDTAPTAGSHLAATLGWMLVPVAAASFPFDNGFGLVARGLAFVAAGLLVMGHARATAYPKLLRRADWALVAGLAICLPLTLLAAYGWYVRLGADYVATYGARTTIELPYTCRLSTNLSDAEGEKGPGDDVSCDDAKWTVAGVTYTGHVTGTVGEMVTGDLQVGHVGSVEGIATKARAVGAEYAAESRHTGPVARFGRVPPWLGLSGGLAAATATLLLLWGPRHRGRPVSAEWQERRLAGHV